MMDAESEGIPTTNAESKPAHDVIDMRPKRKVLMSQQSTVATRRQQAVCVRRAHKIYGTKSNPHVILDGLNMTVPKGNIYGLLGASGCGKTTLLSCIVGRRRLNSGEIWVLGGKPGTRGSGVPGPRIGYMPQEIALYGEFTLRETLIYFGWIYGMTTNEVEDKLDFFMNMLQLPNAGRFVKSLSGGQQRRMSLAAALIHEPELIILDEPTAGVDPVVRQVIWDYLVEITKFARSTVIITTHYIDETRQAHTIGLMRGGKFLAEDSPTNLLKKFQADSLEDVFLKLSVMQNMGKRRRSSIAKEVIQGVQLPSTAMANPALDLTHDEDNGEISGEFGDNISMSSRGPDIMGPTVQPAPPLPPQEEDDDMSCIDHFKILKGNHMKALVWKNFMWMWRNISMMAFMIGLPVGQIIIFCTAIGHDPQGLTLIVTNNELSPAQFLRNECPITRVCPAADDDGPNITFVDTLLSCWYLDHITKRNNMKLKYVKTEQEAIKLVQNGEAWGSLLFPKDFTKGVTERIWNPTTEGSYLDASMVDIKLDMSNQQIGTLLNRDLLYSFFDFTKHVVSECSSQNISEKVGGTPVSFETPIYGTAIPSFTDFAAPGIQLTLIFFMSVALTSGAMLIERNEGMLERCLVSGVTGVEFLFGHVVTQFCVMAFQTALVLIFSFLVFGITINGDIVAATILVLKTGFCGMCFGFVISCAVDNERSATYMALGSFLPLIMLCGIIWPIEGMHPLLKAPALFLPLTKSTESLRSILQRGWAFSNPNVYVGFVSTGIWILIFLTFSILLLKFKKG